MTEQERERRAQQRKRSMREREDQQQQTPAGIIRVLTFTWCSLRGLSKATGRRVIKAGKVKVTQMSERRIGIREDHDREYLDNCVRDAS